MKVSIPSILLGLCGKCVLDWALVLPQGRLACRSFLGVFGASLALVDTVLALAATALHVQGDGRLLGLRLTRHHVCLLVQIMGQIYSSLQWPVGLTSALDHCLTLSGGTPPARRGARKAALAGTTSFLWVAAFYCTFRLVDFHPVLEDESPYLLQQCWVFHTSGVLQVTVVLSLTVGCAVLYLRAERFILGGSGRPLLSNCPARVIQKTLSRREIIWQAAMAFMNTWALFLPAAFLLLPVGLPDYLGLNVPWLCLLNSALIGVILCAGRPASRLARGLAAFPLDYFCDWRLSSSTQEASKGHGGESVDSVVNRATTERVIS